MEGPLLSLESVAPRALRYSLALVVLWIGALKFLDPSHVVGLLEGSLPLLASAGVVYLLGVLEVVAPGMLLLGFGIRYAALGLAGLFLGTLAIFLIAPSLSYADTGFPMLTLLGEFLLKDIVLLSAALVIATSQGGPAASTGTF